MGHGGIGLGVSGDLSHCRKDIVMNYSGHGFYTLVIKTSSDRK